MALVVATAGISGGVGACTSFGDEEVDQGPSDAATADAPLSNDSSVDDASVDGSPAPDGAKVDAGPPPGMVLVAGASKPFFIDRAEVTSEDFAIFRAAGATFGSDPRCAWKDSGVSTPAPAAAGDLPVVRVDWCDALFYCKSVGKRLCGAIGGGPTPPSQIENGASSQWAFACAGAASAGRYSYGAVHVPGVCNDDSPGQRERVASRPACVGATAGVFDLSGNVAEWEDSCIEKDGGTRREGSCTVRPGSFLGPSSASRCDEHDERQRHDTYDDVGFRCCKDL